MFRRLLAAFALLELLVPERIVDAGERLAFENPGECDLRPWTIPIARLEAVAFWYAARRGGASWTRFLRTLGLIGLPAALAPSAYLRFGLWLAYEDPDCCEPRPWVAPATRLLGLAYLLAALVARRRSRATE